MHTESAMVREISLGTGSGTLRPDLCAFLRPFIRKRHEGKSKK